MKTEQRIRLPALVAGIFAFAMTPALADMFRVPPGQATAVAAETIVTTTRLSMPDFDDNHDGIISTPEVGARLFRIYDVDGNMVIDDNEYERKAVLTVVPVERSVTVNYDLDGDGLADHRTTTYETFIYHIRLSRFDIDRNGLSPREFMGTGFLKVDINNDQAIDMNEWRASYSAQLAESLKEKARVNE